MDNAFFLAKNWRVRSPSFPIIPFVLLITVSSAWATVFEFEFASDAKGYGGTCDYSPTKLESRWFSKLSEKDRSTLQTPAGEKYPSSFHLAGHQNEFVSWWGVVRKIKRSGSNSASLLIQNTYDDGQTDCSFQTVQLYGAGDFEVDLSELPRDIIPLVLVRVYGVVTETREGRPVIKADYVRVWHWFRFNFMDFGEDQTNPEWKRRRKLPPNALIYDLMSTEYYLQRLGPTKEEWEEIKAYHRDRLPEAAKEKASHRD
jgi:hypothetical protein